MNQVDFSKLAKTELHCHLDGSLSLPMIRQLAAMEQISIPASDDELKSLVTAPADITCLNEYLKTFDFIRPLLQTEEALELAAYDVAKQSAEENVIYTEIRFAPELSMDKGLSVAQVVRAVCRGLQKAEKDFGIVAKALVCGLRQNDLEATMAMFTEVKASEEPYVVGADFAGNEVDFPAEGLSKGIQHAHDLGFKMTLHAGEQCGCATNIAYAIQAGVKRTGHTTAIMEIPGLLESFVAADLTAELALTSNLQTKAIETIADYPYLDLKAAGANISINTDNRTVSDTNLTKEYGLFAAHFGTSPTDFYQHNQDAIKGSFASDSEKELLLQKLAEGYAPFL
ncbi:adenosine deaminase [Streptococcus hillyeri]|uniref:adenosine deaminase n=1 Tax=Streptococcus hillyeri TaxID=2282420 RepID=A0A3L9DVU0_9STRE|nr:adenosine deaminase [Streptococcus hillyeri]RLY02900.1 adenosine deaminase [Streptococcus hillyeri]